MAKLNWKMEIYFNTFLEIIFLQWLNNPNMKKNSLGISWEHFENFWFEFEYRQLFSQITIIFLT